MAEQQEIHVGDKDTEIHVVFEERGKIRDCAVGSGAGTWVINESISWGIGTGIGYGRLLDADDLAGGSTAQIVIIKTGGADPVSGTTITGAGGATAVISGTPAELESYPVDVSGASKIELVFVKPDDDETIVVKDITGVFGTDGTDGDAYYATENPDAANNNDPFLDIDGVWKGQGYAEWTSGWSGHSTTFEFEVFPNLRP